MTLFTEADSRYLVTIIVRLHLVRGIKDSGFTVVGKKIWCKMSSNFIDSMLPKYQSEAGPGVVNYNPHQPRMYPYVSVPHQTSASTTGCVPYCSNTEIAKSCRFSNDSSSDTAANYSLNLQNCSTTPSMVSPSQFYHHPGSDVSNSLNSCSQNQASTAPDIPRYPWMSITGELGFR